MWRIVVLFVWTLLSACGTILITHPTAEDLAARRGFEWDSVAPTPNYTIYYEAGLTAESTGASFEQDAEASWVGAHAFLQMDVSSEPVFIFVVQSRERMRALTGLSVSATGFYNTRVICVVAGERALASPVGHELVHVIAMSRWGAPERWVNEGLATAYGGRISGYALHDLAKHLLETGSLPSLRAVVESFSRLENRISYVAAGSFVSYLRDSYGMGVVLQVWQRGWRALPAATGLTWPELESEWLGVVRAADAEGAAIVISLMSLVNLAPRLASAAAFLCLICFHLLWPAISPPASIYVSTNLLPTRVGAPAGALQRLGVTNALGSRCGNRRPAWPSIASTVHGEYHRFDRYRGADNLARASIGWYL